MRSAETWVPTKYTEESPGHLRAARSIGYQSRLIADRVAGFYSDAIPKYVSGELLDLGCGTAPLYGLYSRYASGVVCVDWENSLHASAHTDHLVDLNKPMTLFPDGRFGTVVLSDVLEHIADPRQTLSEIHRVLRPGGHLLMNVPFIYWLHETPHDYFRYTRFALEMLCRDASLEVLALESIGGVPEILGDICAKVLNRVPYVGRLLSAVAYGATLGVVSSAPGRWLSDRSREAFPLGYTLVAVRAPSGEAGPRRPQG